jgi:hypothetical protein
VPTVASGGKPSSRLAVLPTRFNNTANWRFVRGGLSLNH